MGSDFTRTLWPIVNTEDWCGEFEGKEEQTKDIPFSLDGFSYGHKGNVERFLRIAERTAIDERYQQWYPCLRPIRTMGDFLALKKQFVLECKTIGIITWLEIEDLQKQIREKHLEWRRQ